MRLIVNNLNWLAQPILTLPMLSQLMIGFALRTNRYTVSLDTFTKIIKPPKLRGLVIRSTSDI